MAGDSATFDQGLRKAISAPFRLLIFIGIAIVVIVFGRMVIDLAWTGADTARLDAAQTMLRAEIVAADSLPQVGEAASERALRWAIVSYEWMYIKTGVDRTLIATPSDLTEPEKAMRRGMNAAAAQPHWQAVMIGTQILAVRAAVLPSALPTLLLAYLLGLVDGGVARWVRRASGGRESSTIYHRAKYSHVVIATILLMVWFWAPIGMELWQLTAAIALFGAGMLRTQMKFYKKYV